MYGILFTMNSTINATSAIHHIDGIPTEALAKKIADDWVKQLSKYKADVHTLVYEMEKPAQTEPPLFTYSTGPAGATINLSQEQLGTKLKQLCYHLDYLKESLCNDATALAQQVENATIAHYIIHELEDALPETQEDPNA